MYRRTVIGVGACGLLAGCLAGGDDPAAALEDFLAAYEAGDGEAADEVIHSDSPWRQDEFWLEDDWGGQEESTTVDERTLREESDENATLERTVEWTDGDGREVEEWALRTEDGEWKIWELRILESDRHH